MGNQGPSGERVALGPNLDKARRPRTVWRLERFTSEPVDSVKERILAVWPEANIHWGFNWGRSQKLTEGRIFFTDTRMVMVGLVSIVSPGFVGVTLAVQAAELERKRQNEEMRTASLDSLLKSDAKNLQIGYDQVSEISYDGKHLRIKFGGSAVRVQPVKAGGLLAYAHPDAVADPKLLMRQTVEAMSAVPALAGKVVSRR